MKALQACSYACLAIASLSIAAVAQQPANAAPAIASAPKENWSDLRVGPKTFGPMSVAVIGQSETPDFTRDLLRVQWRAADPIDLFVVKPHGVAVSPVILYLYSFPSDTARFWDDGWCKRATQGGFAAVGFVSALTGQRYANRPMKEWFVSELPEALAATTHDVQMVLNYLGTRTDLAAQHVGMYGQGSGASVAILAASVDPRIVALDLLDPWGDWPDWLKSSPEVPDEERATYLQPAFLARVAPLDPVLALPRLALQSLRVQQVMDEPITPLLAKKKIAAAVPPPGESVAYANEREHLNAWRVSGLSGWLRLKLTPAPPQPAR